MDAREQEKAFERLLARTLRQSLEPGSAECPAPDTLAGYADRQLSGEEAARWEPHFAQCARCQQVLAAMTTTEAQLSSELVAAAAAAKPAAAVPAAASVRLPALKTSETPRRYLYWRWLAPTAAAAAAVVLWYVARPAPQPGQTPAAYHAPAAAETQIAQNNAPPAAALEDKLSRSGETPGGEPAKLPATPAARMGKHTRKSEALQEAPTAPTPAAGTSEEGRARGALAERRKETDQVAALRAAPGEPAAPTADVAAAAPKPGASTMGAGASGVAAPAPPAAQAGGKKIGQDAPAFAVQPLQTERKLKVSRTRAREALVVIAAPAGTVRWRVGPGGAVARSGDAGRTWQPQVSGVEAELLAGATPSEAVCWVVGRDATILRTTDGEHWEKIASPARVDWTGVQAQDALRARIFAANHLRYDTEDGGRTWRALLAQ